MTHDQTFTLDHAELSRAVVEYIEGAMQCDMDGLTPLLKLEQNEGKWSCVVQFSSGTET